MQTVCGAEPYSTVAEDPWEAGRLMGFAVFRPGICQRLPVASTVASDGSALFPPRNGK